MNELIIDEGVYRTAPATLVVLLMYIIKGCSDGPSVILKPLSNSIF